MLSRASPPHSFIQLDRDHPHTTTPCGSGLAREEAGTTNTQSPDIKKPRQAQCRAGL